VTVTKFDNGHWRFPEQLNFEKAFGFIYLIRERDTGVMYIGRKNFRGTGKLNKGKQSNWRYYTSSSNELNSMMETYGNAAFDFYVLEQYMTPGGVGWAEVWTQCHVETPTNQETYLNRLIDKISWRSKEEITPRHKARIKAITELK
jgi:hypothetical protein